MSGLSIPRSMLKWPKRMCPKFKGYVQHFLVGGFKHLDYFFHILGMSSSQLTISIIFQRGGSTTNQFFTAKPNLGL
jgi:hypothetical protein